MPTTFLFVPAHDARKVSKALASPADAIILDLEDAVPEQMKSRAREAAARVVRDTPNALHRVWVRVNSAQTPHHQHDLGAIRWDLASGLVFPKAEEAGSIRSLHGVTTRGLLLIVESATGLANVTDLVGAAPVAPTLALGTWDLAVDLGLATLDPDESELIWHARCQLVLNSRTLRLPPPIDGVFSRITDTVGFASATDRVRRLGFGGKLLVHPSQIPIAARIFAGTDVQVAEACDLVQAYERAERLGVGAINFRGQMIDRVHVERARALIAQWAGSKPSLQPVERDSGMRA